MTLDSRRGTMSLVPARERFGAYVVHESIGAGGMATVHRATIALDGGGEREVALKRLHPELAEDRRFVDYFVREAKLAVRLSHPNIVRILDLGCIGSTYFIAMELVHGRSLLSLMRKAFLKRRQPPIGVVLALAAELCDALDYAHGGDDGGIVHRDLSPANLLVTDDGHLKIIDFGIARPIQSRMPTGGGVVKGKLGYMAVEALTGGQVDGRADLFSTGVVMWELLTCRRLFKARTHQEMISMVHDAAIVPPSQLNPECREELDEVVVRALSRSVDERWQAAAAMRRALETVRRYYNDRSSARQVTSWVQRLRAESAVTNAVEDTSPYIDIRIVPPETQPNFDTEATKPQIRALPRGRPHR